MILALSSLAPCTRARPCPPPTPRADLAAPQLQPTMAAGRRTRSGMLRGRRSRRPRHLHLAPARDPHTLPRTLRPRRRATSCTPLRPGRWVSVSVRAAVRWSTPRAPCLCRPACMLLLTRCCAAHGRGWRTGGYGPEQGLDLDGDGVAGFVPVSGPSPDRQLPESVRRALEHSGGWSYVNIKVCSACTRTQRGVVASRQQTERAGWLGARSRCCAALRPPPRRGICAEGLTCVCAAGPS